MRSLAVYIHIPFCAKHCAYCDFNTYVEKHQSGIVQNTVDAIRRDIATSAPLGEGRLVDTVFFGGGTPTFLSADQITSILQTVRETFCVSSGAEISSEANPGSSDAEKFEAMYRAGFNRISIGVQSFDDRLLVELDRFHSSCDAERAFMAARSAGFKNINLDLMFGLPYQTLDLWSASMERACALKPEHLSLYALTLEPGTRFERRFAGGKLPLPDEDAELAMYERSIVGLQAAGYEHYEVSNFAKPGVQCRHNLVYWHNEEYLGFGPGAVSYLGGRRWKSEKLPMRYAAKIDSGESVDIESEQLDAVGALGETMMLGLRLRSGIDTCAAAERFGIDPLVRFAPVIERLRADRLLTISGSTLTLTHRGLLLANDVLAEFVA